VWQTRLACRNGRLRSRSARRSRHRGGISSRTSRSSPPGRSTRAASAITAGGLAAWLRRQKASTASNETSVSRAAAYQPDREIQLALQSGQTSMSLKVGGKRGPAPVPVTERSGL
jgi:hypothetical protein